ncbi:unnamed protein product [Brassica napus]|uniref:(rape) hypothetical protein n=1 Tax=Brassica napus TaxID=3708 RepID=A0A816RCG6_BRANA|nr:unnamed protein product [Brassica napus]
MAPLTALQNIYALMQFTPDLSSGDCDNCLRQSARDYQSKEALLCGQAAFLGGTCIHTAFDKFTVASPPPPPLPMASPPPEDDQARTTNNDKICSLSEEKVNAKMQRIEVESDSDILTPQSSQYDFNTIEAAQTSFRGVISSVKVDFGRNNALFLSGVSLTTTSTEVEQSPICSRRRPYPTPATSPPSEPPSISTPPQVAIVLLCKP